MKTLLALIIATAAFFATTPKAEAGGIQIRLGFGHGHGSSYGGGHGHGHGCRIYRTHTCEVCRRYFTKTYHNSCGHCYTQRYATITYRDYYSNGTTRCYPRTVRV